MSWHDFITGKYGLSHGVITLVMIVMGWVLGDVCGSLIASGIALGAYYMREAVQGHSYNPLHWGTDGIFDFTLPVSVIWINVMVIAWSA